MIDIQLIRDNPQLVAQKAQQKNIDIDVNKLLEADKQRRQLLTEAEELRQQRNQQAAASKGQKPTEATIAQAKKLKEQLAELDTKLAKAEATYLELLKQVPNLALDTVPVGKSEADNQMVKTIGQPVKFDFEPKNHAQIAQARGWLDKERAAKVAGARFAYIKGDMVKLQFAIIQFIFDKLTDQAFLDEIIAETGLRVSNKTFLPILPPYMLRTELYEAMDRLEPRDDRYKIEDEDLWLQGSAEHVLGSMHANEIIDQAELPLRYIGYATSFRREAGTYGKDMEGIFRMHQFDKLEMESLTTAAEGLAEHQFLIAIQEKIMKLLGIPYQLIQKCTADIGKPNASGVDINGWMPGQNQYRETHTADYMTDYQARRLQTRVRLADGSVELVHNNDATAAPLSRVPIAIIENYQTADGHVSVPRVLQPYMGGKTQI